MRALSRTGILRGMSPRLFPLLVVAMGFALAPPSRAQVGDAPPPPVPLEEVDIPPVEAPADPADWLDEEPEGEPVEPHELDEGRDEAFERFDRDEGRDEEAPEPGAFDPSWPPPGEPPPGPPLPPPDVAQPLEPCPSASPWPIAGAAAGLAGGLTFTAGAVGLLALSWWATMTGSHTGIVPVALLVGSTTLPFLAGLGAGAIMLPLGRPVRVSHFAELCGICGASWALSLCIVGAALGGSSLDCGSPSCGGCGGCDAPLGDLDGDSLDAREDVYWAALGAGLGAIGGAAVGWLVAYGGSFEIFEDSRGSLLPLGQVVGGAALGAAVLGALGGAFGASELEEEIAESAPAHCREHR